jgi:hypothetical protein
MARYDHLPIYRQAQELMVYVETVVRGFSRYHKYTIGTRLREATWQVLTLIVKTNNTPAPERRPRLVQLRDAVAEVDIALTTAKELKAFAKHEAYVNAARMAVDLGRQSEGWLKSARPTASPGS